MEHSFNGLFIAYDLFLLSVFALLLYLVAGHISTRNSTIRLLIVSLLSSTLSL